MFSITIESLENARTDENKQGIQFFEGDHLTEERDAQMAIYSYSYFSLLRRSYEEIATHLHTYLGGDGHSLPYLSRRG